MAAEANAGLSAEPLVASEARRHVDPSCGSVLEQHVWDYLLEGRIALRLTAKPGAQIAKYRSLEGIRISAVIAKGMLPVGEAFRLQAINGFPRRAHHSGVSVSIFTHLRCHCSISLPGKVT